MAGGDGKRTETRKACCLVSEILEEAGLDRQKASAERIAKGKVSKGYSVHNMLTVAPRS